MPSELFVVGVSWKTAPVDLREKLAFPGDEAAAALQRIVSSSLVDEAVLVSTCNRVEIYGCLPATSPVSVLPQATAEIRNFLATSRGISAELLADAVYERTSADAVKHLFGVASALDSMVLGESQILGQLKDAYGAAMSAQTTGPVLSRAMETSFQVAKRVRSETGLSRGAANVSSVAVELAKHVFGDLLGKHVLVIGAGKMSALAARHLRSHGGGPITVVNRSPERAQALAAEVEGTARQWYELDDLLQTTDVVISSTGAKEPILTKSRLKAVVRKRRYRPLVILDIAVPRDVEPSASKVDGVFLFDIDDLRRVAEENIKERETEANAAWEIVATETDGFCRWLKNQHVVPTIRSLRDYFHTVTSTEVEKCLRIVQANPDPKAVEAAIRRMGDLVANKLLHTPTSVLKQDDGTQARDLSSTVQMLFSLPAQTPEPAAKAEDAAVNVSTLTPLASKPDK